MSNFYEINLHICENGGRIYQGECGNLKRNIVIEDDIPLSDGFFERLEKFGHAAVSEGIKALRESYKKKIEEEKSDE